MPLLLGYWMMQMQLQLTGRLGACWKLEPGGRFVVVMDTVVGLGRHKRFPLTQNPLTGAGFLSRASLSSVVMLAVVFRSLARPEWTFQAQGFQSSICNQAKETMRQTSKESCLRWFYFNIRRCLPLFHSILPGVSLVFRLFSKNTL